MRCHPVFLAAAIATAGSAAHAQIAPITIPKGAIRLDFQGLFETFDWRWRDGTREQAGADLAATSVSGAMIPTLATADTRIQRITGNPNLKLSLGTSHASKLVRLGTGGIGVAYGLSNRLTIFGNVPIVRVQVASTFEFDPASANAGLNLADPFFGNPTIRDQTLGFLNEFQSSIATLSSKIDAGDYNGNPTLLALANQTLARATVMQVDLADLLVVSGSSSAFTPISSSEAGVAIVQAIEDLQNTLSQSLGVSGFSSLPYLPGQTLTAEQFTEFVERSDGPIAARPLTETPTYAYLGDIEIGAGYSLVDNLTGNPNQSGLRIAGTATVRLRTAQLPNQSRLLEVGTGDRQPDVDLRFFADYAARRWGSRFTGGYNLQLPGNQLRRVAPYNGVIAPVIWLAGVRRNPGDVISLGAEPFYRLARSFAIVTGVDYWRKGEDTFDYVSGQEPPPGADLNSLSLGTGSDALLVSAGISFAHNGIDKRGRRRMPMDAGFRFQRVIHSGRGVVPDASTVRVNLRFYLSL